MPFALSLYCGLIAFNIFAETVGRAPAAVRSQPSYVKKIIFPLEILPIVPLGAALIHAGFNATILVIALVWTGYMNSSAILVPLLLLPLVLFSLGLAWFLAAWGVFIKDMSQIVPVFVQMLMFLSPVFYPVSVVPEQLRPLYMLNPVGAVIEALRASFSGMAIDWQAWSVACFIGVTMLLAGFAFFQHSRDEFADAL